MEVAGELLHNTSGGRAPAFYHSPSGQEQLRTGSVTGMKHEFQRFVI